MAKRLSPAGAAGSAQKKPRSSEGAAGRGARRGNWFVRMIREIASEVGLTHTTESMGWIQIVAAPEDRDRAREFLVHLGSSAFVSRYLEALYHQPTAAVGAGVKKGTALAGRSSASAEIVFAPLFVYGSSLPLNGQSASLTCSDKAAAATIMEGAHIPHVPHRLGTSPMSTYSGFNSTARAAKGTFRWLCDMLHDHLETGGLVLKPKDGSQGSDTFRVRNQLELEQAWLKLLGSGVASGGGRRDFVACPFFDLVAEWRCVFLDGEMRLCFRKTPARVVGDGESTLASLIAAYERDVLKTTKTGGGGGARGISSTLKIGGWAAGGSGGSRVASSHSSMTRWCPRKRSCSWTGATTSRAAQRQIATCRRKRGPGSRRSVLAQCRRSRCGSLPLTSAP